jgi:DNA-binding beta-propeller fold protein YncE
MDESSLAAMFEQAVAARPPTPDLITNALQTGRKLRMRHHIKVAIATIAGIGIVAAVAPAALGALSHPAPANGRRARGILYVADANGAVTPVRLAAGTAGRRIQLSGAVPNLGEYGPASPMAAPANGKVVYVDSGRGIVTPVYTSTGKAGRPIRAASHELTSLVVASSGRVAYAVEPGHGVVPINLVTRRPGKLIRDIGAGQLTITPDGKTLYLVDGQGIAPIRTATDSRLRPIQHTVGAWAILGFSPDSQTLYLASSSGIYAVSTATNTVRALIRIPGSVQQLVMSASGKVAYALAYPLHARALLEAYPVNLATATAGKPIIVPDHAYAYSLAITPDGRTLYMFGNGPREGTLWPVRTATDTPLKAILSGFNYSSFLGVSPDGSMAYAVVQPLRSVRYYVVGIPTATNKPDRAIPLGKGRPVAIAFAP